MRSQREYEMYDRIALARYYGSSVPRAAIRAELEGMRNIVRNARPLSDISRDYVERSPRNSSFVPGMGGGEIGWVNGRHFISDPLLGTWTINGNVVSEQEYERQKRRVL